MVVGAAEAARTAVCGRAIPTSAAARALRATKARSAHTVDLTAAVPAFCAEVGADLSAASDEAGGCLDANVLQVAARHCLWASPVVCSAVALRLDGERLAPEGDLDLNALSNRAQALPISSIYRALHANKRAGWVLVHIPRMNSHIVDLHLSVDDRDDVLPRTDRDANV